MKLILAAVFVSVFVALPCNAQEKTTLKNEDIVRMTKSGLGEDVILAVITQTQSAFRTTPKDLADLRKAKVSESVIQAMISAVPVSLEPTKSAVDPRRIITEGVGWGEFTVGASGPALEHALGLPDYPLQIPMVAWRKLGVTSRGNTGRHRLGNAPEDSEASLRRTRVFGEEKRR